MNNNKLGDGLADERYAAPNLIENSALASA